MSIVNLASTMLTPDYPTMYLIRSKVMEEALRREGARFEGIVGTFLNETTSNKSSKNVKFEVNNDGRIFILGLDHPVGTSEYSAKVPKEVVFGPLDGTRNPGINVVTGLFSDGPYDRPFSRPWLLISESSELSLISERRLKKQLRVLTYVSIAVASIPIAINGALSNFRSGQSTSAQRVWIMTWLAFGVCYAPYSRSTYSGFFNWLQVLVFFAPSIGSFVVVGQMLMQYGTCLELS